MKIDINKIDKDEVAVATFIDWEGYSFWDVKDYDNKDTQRELADKLYNNEAELCIMLPKDEKTIKKLFGNQLWEFYQEHVTRKQRQSEAAKKAWAKRKAAKEK
jgi:hypothetical protein